MTWVFYALVVALGVYECFAWERHRGETISEIVWRASTGRPLVPFLAGMLAGHFFFWK